MCCARPRKSLAATSFYYKRELPFVVVLCTQREEGVCVLAGVPSVGGLAPKAPRRRIEREGGL